MRVQLGVHVQLGMRLRVPQSLAHSVYSLPIYLVPSSIVPRVTKNMASVCVSQKKYFKMQKKNFDQNFKVSSKYVLS